MSIEESIVAALKKNLAVRSLVSDRIYPMLAPAGAPLPHVTYQRISGVPDTTMDGEEAGGLVNARLQVNSYAADYPSMRKLWRAMRAVLIDYSDDVIQSCNEVGQGDILDASPDNAGNRTFGFRSDFQVWASEQ